MTIQKMTQTPESDSIVDDLVGRLGASTKRGKVVDLAKRHMEQANECAVRGENQFGLASVQGRGLVALALLHEQRVANLLQLAWLDAKI